MLTTAEAAAVLGVHQRTLRRYLASGLLGHRRLPGGHYRIPEEALAEFWRRNDVQALRPRHRGFGSNRTADARQSQRSQRTRSRPSRQRARLDTASPPTPYDLSAATLAALRSRFA
jgi:excisionase family DNA binding protein